MNVFIILLKIKIGFFERKIIESENRRINAVLR